MSLFHTAFPCHGIVPYLLGLLIVISITSPIAETQSTLPLEEKKPELGFNPLTGTVAVLIIAVASAIAVYSIYTNNCSRAAAGGEGSSRVGRARRAMERGSGIIHPPNPVIVDNFPKLMYSEVKGLRLGKGALECTVCLAEFEDNDMLRLVPRCGHVFHADCIDKWLTSHGTCPVCRAELAPQPGETAYTAIQPVDTICNNESSLQVVVEDDRSGDVEQGEEEQDLEPAEVTIDTTYQCYRCVPGSFRTRILPRSHSTGHSLVHFGQDREQYFTLKPPIEVRKEVMNELVASVPGLFFIRYFRAASTVMPTIGAIEGGSLGRSSSRTNGAFCERARIIV